MSEEKWIGKKGFQNSEPPASGKVARLALKDNFGLEKGYMLKAI